MLRICCCCCLCRGRRHQPAQISLLFSHLSWRLCIRLDLTIAAVGPDVSDAAEAGMNEGEGGRTRGKGRRDERRGCFCFCFYFCLIWSEHAPARSSSALFLERPPTRWPPA